MPHDSFENTTNTHPTAPSGEATRGRAPQARDASLQGRAPALRDRATERRRAHRSLLPHLIVAIALCALSAVSGCAAAKSASSHDTTTHPPSDAKPASDEDKKVLERTQGAQSQPITGTLKDAVDDAMRGDQGGAAPAEDRLDTKPDHDPDVGAGGAAEQEPEPTRKRRRARKATDSSAPSPTTREAIEPKAQADDEQIDAAPASVRMLDSTGENGPSWARRRAIHKAGRARQEMTVLLAPLGGSARALARGGDWTASGLSCPRTCELAEAICTSRDAICDVAKTYPDERDLPADCDWADNECEGAKVLCSACRGGH